MLPSTGPQGPAAAGLQVVLYRNSMVVLVLRPGQSRLLHILKWAETICERVCATGYMCVCIHPRVCVWCLFSRREALGFLNVFRGPLPQEGFQIWGDRPEGTGAAQDFSCPWIPGKQAPSSPYLPQVSRENTLGVSVLVWINSFASKPTSFVGSKLMYQARPLFSFFPVPSSNTGIENRVTSCIHLTLSKNSAPHKLPLITW